MTNEIENSKDFQELKYIKDRYNIPASVLFFKLDSSKTEELKRILRFTDLVYELNEDDKYYIVVILPFTEEEESYAVFKKIEHNVLKHETEFLHSELKDSFSGALNDLYANGGEF